MIWLVAGLLVILVLVSSKGDGNFRGVIANLESRIDDLENRLDELESPSSRGWLPEEDI